MPMPSHDSLYATLHRGAAAAAASIATSVGGRPRRATEASTGGDSPKSARGAKKSGRRSVAESGAPAALASADNSTASVGTTATVVAADAETLVPPPLAPPPPPVLPPLSRGSAGVLALPGEGEAAAPPPTGLAPRPSWGGGWTAKRGPLVGPDVLDPVRRAKQERKILAQLTTHINWRGAFSDPAREAAFRRQYGRYAVGALTLAVAWIVALGILLLVRAQRKTHTHMHAYIHTRAYLHLDV
jgi:hypothetical protein